jgi:hypothetical protein
MQYNSCYVYGVIDGKLPKEMHIVGIGGRKDIVFAIPFKDISAIVSFTPFEEYDPTEQHTLEHEAVIQEIIKSNITLAPMQFCTILKSEQDVKKLLSSGYLALKKNLLKVRNRLEFDVKMFLSFDRSQGVNDHLVLRSKELAENLYSSLQHFSDDTVLIDQVTGDMILNVSVLLAKEKKDHLFQKIETFDKGVTEEVRIRVSGPTAPYNFVSMPKK